MSQIILSGVKPTGKPHIGNYFGAMKQFVDLQNKGQSFFMLADYHSLNQVQNKEEMQNLILDLYIDYLAIGLDPKKSTIFKQSDVSAHTELCWIFDAITTMPYLMRAHAFKDAEAKNKDINVGTFNYPMLMAADILLYSPDIVPVGNDQKQHVEIARDIAQKFNNTFGETFKLPKELIMKEVAIVPGIDGQKMSKSYNNTIPLFATNEELQNVVMKISTDSKGVEESKNPDEVTIFNIHKLLLNKEEEQILREKYEKEGKEGLGYKEAKELLIEDLITFIKPLRERRERISQNKKKIIKMLKKGGLQANKVAENKMKEIREKIGVGLYN